MFVGPKQETSNFICNKNNAISCDIYNTNNINQGPSLSHHTHSTVHPPLWHIGDPLFLSVIHINTFKKIVQHRITASSTLSLKFVSPLYEKERKFCFTSTLFAWTVYNGPPNTLAWTVPPQRQPNQEAETEAEAETKTATAETKAEAEVEAEATLFMGPNQESDHLQTDWRVKGAWPFKSCWLLQARVILQLHMQLQRCCSWKHKGCPQVW